MAWSPAIRFIHWALAFFVVLNQFVLEAGDDFHRWVGYSAVALVGVRFYFGFCKAGLSAFNNFPLDFKSLESFSINLLSRDGDDYSEGHNPIASYVYILIWLVVIFLALSGWLMGLDRFWGNETLERVHSFFSNLLLFLILLHLAGLVYDSIKFKRKSWLSMINGKSKREL